jgi:hypothetical protein
MEATDESVSGQRSSEPDQPVDERECPDISAYSTTERKTVFTESDNDNGWIATDLTAEIRA